jgi:hypothetical protein
MEDFHAGTCFQADVAQTPGKITLSREGDNYIAEGNHKLFIRTSKILQIDNKYLQEFMLLTGYSQDLRERRHA